MKNINEKIDKYLKEANVEDYDISDEVQEALDELKDLAKLTGGTFSGEHAVMYPFKKDDDWEVSVSINDEDRMDYDITVNIYNRAVDMGGGITLISKKLPDTKMIQKIGQLQKAYNDAVENIIQELKKYGKVYDMGELIGKKLLGEAREDFYGDRKDLVERLEILADMVGKMNLPDPDSDYYRKNRAKAKEVLTTISAAVSKLEATIFVALKNYKF